MSNFLIIEDQTSKYNEIKATLLAINIHESNIHHANCVNDAMRLFSANIYQVVILDLNLPIFTDGKCHEDAGIKILEKLQRSPSKYNLPEKILGLTSYDNLKKNQISNFTLLSFNIYSFDSEDWKEVLKNTIQWSGNSLLSQNKKINNNILLSIHGIRTLGTWQEKLEQRVLNKKDNIYEVINFRFNYFSSIQLLIPRCRKFVIDRLIIDLVEINNKNPNCQISIICHSFGTYALVKALENLPISCNFNIKNLILVSSVMKSTYDFSLIKTKFNIEKIICECGFNDNVLILSYLFCHDMGMAGRTGFIGDSILNRFYKGGHSFFNRNENFIDEHWIPILDNRIIKTDERNFGFFRENIEIIINFKPLFLSIILILVIIFYIIL